MTPRRLLRKKEAQRLTGDANSTFYLRIKQGLMTKPVKIGPRNSAWPEHEIQQIVDARIAGKAEGEIRELVSALEAQRVATTWNR